MAFHRKRLRNLIEPRIFRITFYEWVEQRRKPAARRLSRPVADVGDETLEALKQALIDAAASSASAPPSPPPSKNSPTT